jgi:hypothetical protein
MIIKITYKKLLNFNNDCPQLLNQTPTFDLPRVNILINIPLYLPQKLQSLICQLQEI